MTKYKVEELTICDGWTNTWHEWDDDNNQIPMVFDTLEDAELELREYLHDYQRAYERGDIDSNEDPNNFRIVKVA